MFEHKLKAGVWAKIFLVILSPIIFLPTIPASQHTSIDLYKNWALDNYPIFEIDGIKLKYVSLSKNINGMFIPPRLILINNNLWFTYNSKMHRYIIEHELMHYYCLNYYHNIDIKHIRCFP